MCVAASPFPEPGVFGVIDLLILLDRSSAMGQSGTGYWEAARVGLSNFVQHPVADGINIGLQYFPLGGQAPASCLASYATPAVDIAALPDNAPAILESLAADAPAGSSPTGPALQGAIERMKAWRSLHNDRRGVIVLVTAGPPTECEPLDTAGLAVIASAGLEDASVETFVVGLGPGLESLHEVAQAGGSYEARLITGDRMELQLESTLFQIVGRSAPCTLEVPLPPAGEAFPVGLVAVFFRPAGSTEQYEIPMLNNGAECPLAQDHGWFFDDPVAPTRMELCPGTCAQMPGKEIAMVFGCPPQLGL